MKGIALKIIIFIHIAILATSSALYADGFFSIFDDDDDDEHHERSERNRKNRSAAAQNDGKPFVAVTMANNVPTVYAESCGECHFSYQANLLPLSSWKKVMDRTSLEDHFGEFLEYEPAVQSALEDYLYSKAGNVVRSKLGKKFGNSVKASRPMEITQTGYFIRKHDEIDAVRMVKENKDVRTYSNCTACHRDGPDGIWDDDGVIIPNFPYYED